MLRGVHEKNLVEDSDAPSNLAIILLPAILDLVPLGLFEDFSLVVTMIYTLATDVISVLPAAIKGMELVIYGSNEHTAMLPHLYGGKNATDVAAAETWIANCRIRRRFKEQGIALLVTAIAIMTIGVLLEFKTRAWVRRLSRRRRIMLKEFQSRDISEPEDRSHGGLLWLIERENAYQHLHEK